MKKDLLVDDFIIHMQNTVLDWNELFGNDVNNVDLIPAQKDFTIEELTGTDELVSSAMNDDDEGILDAICDVVYTGFFYLALSRNTYQLNERFVDHSDAISFMVGGITLKMALEQDNIDYFKSYLLNLLTFARTKYDLKKAFARVTESNYSKAIRLEGEHDEINNHLRAYKKEIESVGRYADVWFAYKNGFYIVKANKDLRENKTFSTGKIIKGSWYHSVEDLGGLEEFVY